MYTEKDIETILLSLGFNLGVFSVTKEDGVDSYFYPFQPLTRQTLTEDLFNYSKASLERINQRKVCFLAKTENNELYALLLECEVINHAAVSVINEFLACNSELTVSELLSNSIFLQILSELYQNTRCTYLSQIQPPVGWEQLVKSIYKNIAFIVQPLPATNADIVFTEFIRQFMLHGEFPLAIDVKQTYQSHLQVCLSKLHHKLQLFQTTAFERYQSIENFLEILFKYAILKEKRKQLPPFASSLEQVELIQAMDLFLKKAVYQQSINIEPFLKMLSVNTLCSLLNCENADEMLLFLQQEHTKQYQHLQQWQNNLKQQQTVYARSWKNYLSWKAKQTAHAVYQLSWIGLGAELFKWLGDGLVSLVGEHQFIVSSKRIISNAIYQLTHIVTASPQQATKAADKTNELLSTSTPLFKVVGGGLGLSLTYLFGATHLLKILLVNNLGFKLSQLLSAETINDAQAKIIQRQYLPGVAGCSRIVHLLFAIVESIYRKDIHYFLSALGGTAGSVSAIYLSQNCFPELKVVAGKSLTEGQVLAMFFISMAGLELGQLFTQNGINLFEHITHCAMAEQAFTNIIQQKSDIYLTGTSQCASLFHSFSFWKSSETPLRLTWTSQLKKHYEAECQIQHENGYVVCEEPIQLQRLCLV